MRRARDEVAGLTLEEAVEEVSTYMAAPSTATLSRLEGLEAVPHDARRRTLAFLLCMGVYGVDPSDLDLGGDDLPPNIAIDLRAVRRQRMRSTKCKTARPHSRQLVAA